MTKTYLIEKLEAMQNAKRENRLRVANLVLENPALMPFLVEQTFEVENKRSIKAAWTLELVCEQQLNLLIPHFNYFVTKISTLKHDSAVRPASKICNFLAIAYHSKKNPLITKNLTSEYINCIIETGFDWMISNHKVAAKAYTMNALFLLGKNTDWAHQELKLILEQNIPKESAAYKARGKITLALINKK